MRLYVNRAIGGGNSVEIFLSHLFANCHKSGIDIVKSSQQWDLELACIEEKNMSHYSRGPVIQRLDGIYLDTGKGLGSNDPIKRTFLRSQGVIYQSNLCKTVADINFGTKEKFVVIHNGTSIEDVSKTNIFMERHYSKIYAKNKSHSHNLICVVEWRKVKRLPSITAGFKE